MRGAPPEECHAPMGTHAPTLKSAPFHHRACLTSLTNARPTNTRTTHAHPLPPAALRFPEGQRRESTAIHMRLRSSHATQQQHTHTDTRAGSSTQMEGINRTAYQGGLELHAAELYLTSYMLTYTVSTFLGYSSQYNLLSIDLQSMFFVLCKCK